MSIASLYIISAPSGAGKTSLISELITQDTEITVAVSDTTRPIRSGEQAGQHYHFNSTEQFKQKIKAGAFLEYAEVFGNFYGTSTQAIDNVLNSGHDVILEIDWQGAQQIRRLRPDALSIFILPPSIETLEQRLCARNQDSQEVINTRLQHACGDICHYDEFDYLVINDNFNQSVQDLASIFKSNRLRLAKQKQRYQTILDQITS